MTISNATPGPLDCSDVVEECESITLHSDKQVVLFDPKSINECPECLLFEYRAGDITDGDRVAKAKLVGELHDGGKI